MWSALSLLDPGLLAYQVYPTPTAPPFSLLAAFPVVLLAFPALVSTPPITSHVSRLTPHTSRVTSHASCLTPRVPRIVFDHVTFAYPEARTPVLRDVSLALPPGAFVLVTGPSGSGKSTLLRCINGLVPHGSGGTVAGNVRVGAIDALRAGPQEMANRVGLVVQSPEAGFVADRVEDEVAFALENAGIPPEDIGARVDEALAITGAAHLRERALATLSGGELQRVAVAAALALRPPVLLLDEPLSQLDPRGDDDVVAFLQELHAQGITVIVAEHRLERLLPCATQVVYLPGDGALWDDAPAAAAARIPLPPPVVELGRELGWEPLPLSVEEALDHASPGAHYVARITLPASCIPSPLLRASALTFTYDGSAALDGVDLTVGRGELVALVGPNGAGKTTLLRAITGLLKPQAGHVWLGDEEITSWDVAKRCLQIGYLPQEPDLLLFAESVTKELRITLDNHGLPDDGRVTTLLGRMGLARHAATYPRDLSVGERQRVALGAVAVTRPVCLLLDEPTRGLDMPLKVALGEMLRVWCAEGMGVLLVTHDVEWVARFADRVVLLDRGRVVAEGDPHDVLPARPDFAPQMARLFPNAGVLTVREVMASQV
jgi:energy-coupling factor transport system ATP-binding protein